MLIEFDSSDTIEGVIRTVTSTSEHFGEDF